MSTIHTFGDSFTFGYGCVEDCHFKPYYSYKKDGDDIWPIHLGQRLEMDVVNYGQNGASNEQIFQSIIENIDSIKENDIVLIGKTVHGRFNIPKDSKWIEILSYVEIDSDWKNDISKKFSKEEFEALINFQYYFLTNPMYRVRDNNRFDFLKKILTNNIKVRNCIIWEVKDMIKIFENITKATNGEIEDLHFSFKGHKQLSEYFFNILSSDKKMI